MITGTAVLPVHAASKAYMSKMPVKWDLKPNKTVVYQSYYRNVGMLNQKAKISDWKITDAEKKGYKQLTFKVSFTTKRNFSAKEVKKMVANDMGVSFQEVLADHYIME